jgi:glycosyltransferase involved in cell wall biosynthesis
MDQKPMVSVVMITYNHEKYIAEAMNGVFMQKCDFNIEFIIANDKSTDTTNRVINEIIDQTAIPDHIKLRYYNHLNNKGMMKNFVWSLEQAKGYYIALCDGDDYWTDPLKLQKQVDFLEGNKCFVGAFHNTAFIDERLSNKAPKPWRTFSRDVFTARDTITKLSLFHTSSYCFRNLNFNLDYLLTKYLISADMMLLGLISKHGKLKLIDETMSVYRKNEGGVTSTESKVKYHKNRIALNKTLDQYYNHKFKFQSKKIIKYHKEQILKHRYPYLFKLQKKLSLNLFK